MFEVVRMCCTRAAGRADTQVLLCHFVVKVGTLPVGTEYICCTCTAAARALPYTTLTSLRLVYSPWLNSLRLVHYP